MVTKLGDACTAHNNTQDLHGDLEFKTKASSLTPTVQRHRQARLARADGPRRSEPPMERTHGVQAHQGCPSPPLPPI